jgi:hypothetical protein
MQDAGVLDADMRVIFERLAPLAHHMVNADENVPREPLGDGRLS